MNALKTIRRTEFVDKLTTIFNVS